jgi:hypothetical protein
MKASKLLALLFVTVLPLTVACKGTNDQAATDDADDTATQTTEQEVAGANQANDLNPVEAQTMVDDVTIGHRVGADGMIAAADQGDDFAPGDPVVVTMKVGDAPAGSKVKLVWYGPGETKIAEEEKDVTQGAQYLTFEATNTSSWQIGDYRAEVWIGDEKVNQQTFNLTNQSESGR